MFLGYLIVEKLKNNRFKYPNTKISQYVGLLFFYCKDSQIMLLKSLNIANKFIYIYTYIHIIIDSMHFCCLKNGGVHFYKEEEAYTALEYKMEEYTSIKKKRRILP